MTTPELTTLITAITALIVAIQNILQTRKTHEVVKKIDDKVDANGANVRTLLTASGAKPAAIARPGEAATVTPPAPITIQPPNGAPRT